MAELTTVHEEGEMYADLIIMRRLTKCILANEHKPTTIIEPTYDFKYGVTKNRIVGWNNCPRCGISTGYTWSFTYSGVTALL